MHLKSALGIYITMPNVDVIREATGLQFRTKERKQSKDGRTDARILRLDRDLATVSRAVLLLARAGGVVLPGQANELKRIAGEPVELE